MKFFTRNSPEVIADSVALSVEDFVAKYKPITNEELLSSAYFEIRKRELLRNPLPAEVRESVSTSTKVTFKVIKVKTPIRMYKEVIPALGDAEVNEAIREEVANPGVEMFNESELPKEDVTSPTEKKERKKRDTSKGDKRDARILELLKIGAKTQEIIEMMENEDFKVHAPQISNVKKANAEVIEAALKALAQNA